jgi:hypothetical protein
MADGQRQKPEKSHCFEWRDAAFRSLPWWDAAFRLSCDSSRHFFIIEPTVRLSTAAPVRASEALQAGPHTRKETVALIESKSLTGTARYASLATMKEQK